MRTLNRKRTLYANPLIRPRLSSVQVQIAQNQGEADLARARKAAEQTVVTATAESQQRVLAGRGEGSRVLQIGLSEAAVLLRKIGSFGDPRLYALQLVAEQLSHASQPLVPERVFLSGPSGDGTAAPTSGMLGTLIQLLVAEKSGFAPAEAAAIDSLKEFTDRMTREAMESMHQVAKTEPAPT